MIKINIEDFIKNPEEKQEVETWNTIDQVAYLMFMKACIAGAGDAYIDDRVTEKALHVITSDILGLVRYRFGEDVAGKLMDEVYLNRLIDVLEEINVKKDVENNTGKKTTGGLN